MGLYVYGKTTTKYDYSRSYSALHSVRWLALLACGCPINFKNGNSTFSWFKCPLTLGVSNPPTIEEAENFNYYLILAGYKYPNLLLHSDCEGSYTKTGKVLKTWGWKSGNSIKLFKELQEIKEKVKVSEETKRSLEVLEELLLVVEDEVKNGIGHILFR